MAEEGRYREVRDRRLIDYGASLRFLGDREPASPKPMWRLPGILAPLIAVAPLFPARAATDEIVVTAVPQDDAALNHAANVYVRRMAEVTELDQYAHRLKSFCPAVIGMDPQYAPPVLARIREAAAATGSLAEAKAGCTANLAIVFTEDGDALVRAMQKREPRQFDALTIAKRKELFDTGRPVRWWYGIEPAGSDGDRSVEGTVHGWRASLISTGLALDLSATVVIVDVTRAHGLPLDAISSYAAMVSLAQINDTGNGPHGVASILGLFSPDNPGEAPGQLTPWDRAYLYALYHVAADRPAWQQRAAMVGRMRMALRAAPLDGAEPAASERPR